MTRTVRIRTYSGVKKCYSTICFPRALDRLLPTMRARRLTGNSWANKQQMQIGEHAVLLVVCVFVRLVSCAAARCTSWCRAPAAARLLPHTVSSAQLAHEHGTQRNPIIVLYMQLCFDCKSMNGSSGAHTLPRWPSLTHEHVRAHTVEPGSSQPRTAVVPILWLRCLTALLHTSSQAHAWSRNSTRE